MRVVLDTNILARVAAAVAGAAEVICTRNRHLRHLDVMDFCSQHGIRVVDDIELLNELRASGWTG